MAEEKRVLMLTNAELGQANIFLAVSHELVSLDPSLKLQIASFAPLAKHVNSIGISSSSPDAKPHPNINFIPLHGPSWKEALFGRSEHQFQELCDMPPTVWNVSKAAKMTRIACPWTSEEVCALVKEIEQIIEDVKPTAVVVDNLFTPAVTVCYKVKPNWIVLSPNTYKEFILAKQPDQQYYWKYPPPRSTVPYPVPWYYWPIVWYMVRTMYLNHDDTWMTDHAKQMKEKIDTDYADWAYISIVPPEGLKVLLASRPEIDFPFDVMPDHITGCGPIVLPSPPLKKTDPDLDAWLSQHPTIYINTGTHATYTEQQAVEMAGALRHLLTKGEKNKKTLQVLWKLSKRGEYETGEGSKVFAALGLKFGELVRITEWIDPDPIAILTSGHIACSVNHGGANSFFDALSAGVPQVILPVWGDTYDFAKRVEWLGIGKFGSPWNAPQCSARELGPILEQVVLGPRSKSMKEKAVELAQLCENNGGGRRVAAQKILEML
ncbi:unnamed protein product [Clonostachys rosea f. rosea IK726]|uniref:Uncharacterized protein n=1 Tax=Clonostachys rosea f. rosea IK726 TaxID=1349383 RepID=A0ACA9TW21_BIOOC|nr:unnamed protein product [Clonostachys rosea f. rosea IK726]